MDIYIVQLDSIIILDRFQQLGLLHVLLPMSSLFWLNLLRLLRYVLFQRRQRNE